MTHPPESEGLCGRPDALFCGEGCRLDVCAVMHKSRMLIGSRSVCHEVQCYG